MSTGISSAATDHCRSRARRVLLIAVVVIVAGLGALLLRPGGVKSARQFTDWMVFHAKLKLDLAQDASAGLWEKGDTATLAGWVEQFRAAWPGESVAVVHGAVVEASAALLHRGDAVIGERVGGQFVPWTLTPWAAEAKLRDELMSRREFLTEEDRYVFRKK